MPEESFGGEQSHLRVVSDRAKASVCWKKIPHESAVSPPDFIQTLELHRCAQGISHRTPEQTPGEMAHAVTSSFCPFTHHFLDPLAKRLARAVATNDACTRIPAKAVRLIYV
jgi:hypothetical protein